MDEFVDRLVGINGPGGYGQTVNRDGVAIGPSDFTHLHVHSEFSLLDGLGRITELVDQAKTLGFDSLAITDHGALYGAVAFYQACKAAQIKPIIGVETYVARRSMTDREGKVDDKPFHLVLLAKDWTGYQNLCQLLTAAHVDGYYYKPRIDRELLAKHARGLIGLSACLAGEVARAVEMGDLEEARRAAGNYRDILGEGNFFLELQDHGLPEQRRLNEQLVRLAPQMGLPLVATNDLHYVRRAQSDAHDVLLCVGTAANLDTPGRMRFESSEFYLKSAAEMAALFSDQPDAIANTRRIAEMVDLELPFGQLRLPDFPVPAGHTVESWLRSECERGLRERYGDITEPLQKRLDYELGVIISMGYAGYFLIVADFVRFAREQGIATTCRGSAPGSIVTYTLGITPVDPILLRAAVRALPQPRPRDDAGHRRRLRGRAARRGHPLRHAQVRQRPRRPDHHLRHDARPRRHPRRRPRAGPGLRRGRPHRQGHSQPARHQARGSAPDLARAARDARRATPRSSGCSSWPSNSRVWRATPQPTPQALSSAASR